MEKEVLVDGKVINLEVNLLSLRSGILPDRKSLEAWVALFIGALIHVF
jgi:hypothetical protein